MMNDKRKNIRKMRFSGFDTDIEQVKDMYDAGEINLNPEYQRNSVWDINQKEALIDSLLSYEAIGLILFNEQGNGIFDVVDGQQRLRTIFEFMDGDFSTNPQITPGEPISYDDICSASDKKHEFLTYPLTANRLTGYDLERVSDFYIKINTGSNLSTGEKLHAVISYLNKTFIREWPKHGIFQKINLKNNRMELEFKLIEIFDSELRSEGEYVYQFQHLKSYGSAVNYYTGILKRFQYSDTTFPRNITNRIEKNFNTILDVFEGNYGAFGHRARDFKIVYYFISNLNRMNITTESRPSKNEIRTFFLSFLAKITDLSSKREKHRRGDDPVPFLATINEDEKPLLDFIDSSRMVARGPITQLINLFLNTFPEMEFKDKQRGFNYPQKLTIYENHDHKCGKCKTPVNFDDAEFDHIYEHSKGGKTTVANGQPLCSDCHKKKTANYMIN
jgi:5-methylcytosine-specific restriction endonuclease McrA